MAKVDLTGCDDSSPEPENTGRSGEESTSSESITVFFNPQIKKQVINMRTLRDFPYIWEQSIISGKNFLFLWRIGATKEFEIRY